MTSQGAAILALGLAALPALPASATAGTGRLVSQWMSRAPAIDGEIAAAEWSEARLVELGNGVSVRIGNDARTLYLAVLDAGDLELGEDDGLVLLFDDEGGTAPVLDDGSWAGLACHQAAEYGEGMLQIVDAPSGPSSPSITFREYAAGTYCPAQALDDRVSSSSTARPEGVTWEAAIPLDGTSPLRAGAGERFALFLLLYRDGAQAGCLPACSTVDVADFRNLVLASGGCNTGPQGFGSGQNQPDLPLDWSTDLGAGSGEAWVQSAVDGDQFYCGMNVTGGEGASACVTNVHYLSAEAEALLRLPLALAGQGSVTVRLRANFQSGASGDFLAFGARYEQISFFSMLLWQTSHGAPGGPGSAVELDLSLFTNNLPLELSFWHHTTTAGTSDGGFAQIDDVELLCGPILFADGFESGLATHWTATLP